MSECSCGSNVLFVSEFEVSECSCGSNVLYVSEFEVNVVVAQMFCMFQSLK